MLIYKVFLPVASPGLAATAAGLIAATNATNTLQVLAIVGGLAVVAVAGVFTIRSNVAKIWREQSEGEKARADKLQTELAEVVKEATVVAERLKVEWAAEIAEMKIAQAAEIAKCIHDTTAEREAKERLQTELDAANARTDMTPVMTLLGKLVPPAPVADR